MAGLFMPPSLTFLLLAVNIPTMLKYICSSPSAVPIARCHPDVYAHAAFRPRRRVVIALGALGALAGLSILLAGIGADWRPYVLIGGWALVGLAYWRTGTLQVAADVCTMRSGQELNAERSPNSALSVGN
jgi:basic amino acid/polyamine antiporter, APA family